MSLRVSLVLGAGVATALVLMAFTPAVTAAPPACVAQCGYLVCVSAVGPVAGFCVVRLNCIDVIWFDQQVGSLHVQGSGCSVHVHSHE